MKTNDIDFIFEAASLKRLERTGWQILGGGNRESIAGHSFMVAVIAYVLAVRSRADTEKVLLMSLFHDFEESRTGDVYKLADLYTRSDKDKAIRAAFSNMPESGKITGILTEYHQSKSPEAKLVKDADTLALCIELKVLMENGNQNAGEWLKANLEILKIKQARELGKSLLKANSQDWWKKQRQVLHKLMAK
ncbi:MAG: hypothetical protein UV73_C0011G0012 [Candidatus Gottesmanbacteria bacterium GW2011_GWA2_43_14]|uniref:5'-deoxynucleotidase n=1 Tax=Candidatus Gottesmanbacteria bacterium GW2011_GWA2_43_14 TaxID=1618443 RepID=A0A0G1DEL5_9BACT|nr:MAG: hypothetical protein UV73_C0011G0012 [Candidatus Gottesmanbacteria bacterium GW2011_GWA2_43_14]